MCIAAVQAIQLSVAVLCMQIEEYEQKSRTIIAIPSLHHEDIPWSEGHNHMPLFSTGVQIQDDSKHTLHIITLMDQRPSDGDTDEDTTTQTLHVFYSHPYHIPPTEKLVHVTIA